VARLLKIDALNAHRNNKIVNPRQIVAMTVNGKNLANEYELKTLYVAIVWKMDFPIQLPKCIT